MTTSLIDSWGPAAGCGLACTDGTLPAALARLHGEAQFGVLATGRYRCRYYTWGAGPPLLIVPGLASDALSFVLVGAALSAHFRCIAYDLPAGRSDGAVLGRCTLADLVADALVLLDHLGERHSCILGYSFGSLVALAALRDQPQRLRRGILVGGFARRRLAPAEVLLARLAGHWHAAQQVLPCHEWLQRQSHHRPFAQLARERWQFLVERSGAQPLAALARRALLLHQADLVPDLPRIRQPVLLVEGDDDPLVPPSCTRQLLQGLPNARQVELVGCGHCAHLTHPGQLAELVRRFLLPDAPTPRACSSECETPAEARAPTLVFPPRTEVAHAP